MTEGDKNVLIPIGGKRQYYAVPLATPSEGDKIALIPIGNKKQYVAVPIGDPSEGDKTVLLAIGNKRQYVVVGAVPPVPPSGSIQWYGKFSKALGQSVEYDPVEFYVYPFTAYCSILYLNFTSNLETAEIVVTDPDDIVVYDEIYAFGEGWADPVEITKAGIWTAKLYTEGKATLLSTTTVNCRGEIDINIADPCFTGSGWTADEWHPFGHDLITITLNESLSPSKGDCETCVHFHVDTGISRTGYGVVSTPMNIDIGGLTRLGFWYKGVADEGCSMVVRFVRSSDEYIYEILPNTSDWVYYERICCSEDYQPHYPIKYDWVNPLLASLQFFVNQPDGTITTQKDIYYTAVSAKKIDRS